MYTAYPAALPGYPPRSPGVLSQVVTDYEEDEFVWPGLVSSGAATIPANNVFGKLGWRVASSGGAAASTALVTTGQSATERGVVQHDVGTGAGAVQGMARVAVGVLTTNFGSGQYKEWSWKFQIPTLSTGAQEFLVRAGYGTVFGSTPPTDAILTETSSAAPHSGNIIIRAYKSGVIVAGAGGVSVPAVAGQWHVGRCIWDGANCFGFVDDAFVGSINGADMPIGTPVGEGNCIVRTAGATSRTLLIGKFRQLRNVD